MGAMGRGARKKRGGDERKRLKSMTLCDFASTHPERIAGSSRWLSGLSGLSAATLPIPKPASGLWALEIQLQSSLAGSLVIFEPRTEAPRYSLATERTSVGHIESRQTASNHRYFLSHFEFKPDKLAVRLILPPSFINRRATLPLTLPFPELQIANHRNRRLRRIHLYINSYLNMRNHASSRTATT